MDHNKIETSLTGRIARINKSHYPNTFAKHVAGCRALAQALKDCGFTQIATNRALIDGGFHFHPTHNLADLAICNGRKAPLTVKVACVRPQSGSGLERCFTRPLQLAERSADITVLLGSDVDTLKRLYPVSYQNCLAAGHKVMGPGAFLRCLSK